MKHTLYEDPVTHRFALVRLPQKFVEGDKLPLSPADRWFETREAALATLVDLLSLEEDELDHERSTQTPQNPQRDGFH